MSKSFDINSDELVRYTNKLEKLHKSALPIAVRSTLNNLAFKGRSSSIRKFKKNFIDRTSDRFIRSHNIANKSKNTFNINEMETSFGIEKGKSRSGDKLEIQEKGGTIPGRDIPIDTVRVGGARKAKIKRSLYKKLYKNKKRGIIYKSGESKIFKTKDRLLRVKRGSKWDTLYVFNRDVKLKSKPFISFGGKEAAKHIEKFYVKNAIKRIEKYKK
jgi:hypothetical protein